MTLQTTTHVKKQDKSIKTKHHDSPEESNKNRKKKLKRPAATPENTRPRPTTSETPSHQRPSDHHRMPHLPETPHAAIPSRPPTERRQDRRSPEANAPPASPPVATARRPKLTHHARSGATSPSRPAAPGAEENRRKP